MTEVEIRSLLTDDITRLIARHCVTPRSSAEIVTFILKARMKTDRIFYERLVGSTLGGMEQNGLITYSEGKWKTKPVTLNVLAKYFGG